MRSPRHGRRELVAVLIAATLAAAGCGQSPSGSPSSTPAPNPSTAAGSSAKRPGSRVTIKDFAYVPARITIKAGTKITWTNTDTANHTVSADSASMPAISNLDKGQSAGATFSKPGTYAYHCDYHPSMHGTVIVK